MCIRDSSYDPAGFGRKNGVMSYKESGVDVARGIDVSVHQGEIDWTKVADAGIEFAMIRVGYRGHGSEGKMMGDTYFQRNIQGALDAGLKVGVYYFSQAVTVEEARDLLRESYVDPIDEEILALPTIQELRQVKNTLVPGESATLTVRRGGEERSISFSVQCEDDFPERAA